MYYPYSIKNYYEIINNTCITDLFYKPSGNSIDSYYPTCTSEYKTVKLSINKTF